MQSIINQNDQPEINNTYTSPTKTTNSNEESSNKKPSSIKNKYKSASGGKSKVPLSHRNEINSTSNQPSKFDTVDIQSRLQNNSKSEGLNRSFSNYDHNKHMAKLDTL